MPIYRLGAHAPKIPASVYIADNAVLIGQIVLGENVSIWSGAVLRGDNEPIVIGDDSNVQEGTVMHTDPGCPLTVGRSVTIGHQAMLHGCTIGDGSLVGIQAIVLNKAVIGPGCLIGAGAIVTEGKEFPGGNLIIGAPAKIARELSPDNVARLKMSAESYAKRGKMFKTELVRIDR